MSLHRPYFETDVVIVRIPSTMFSASFCFVFCWCRGFCKSRKFEGQNWFKLCQLFCTACHLVAPQLHGLAAVSLDHLDFGKSEFFLPLKRNSLRVSEGRGDATVVDLGVRVQEGFNVLENNEQISFVVYLRKFKT